MSSRDTLPSANFVLSATALSQVPQDPRPHIVIAGRSNVGKSSLLNALLGQKKLARVSATPGRTQALNFFLIDDTYYIVDLPGYGFARAPVAVKDAWGALVDEYLDTCANVSAALSLLDCRRNPEDEERMLWDFFARKNIPFAVVLTKTDKLGRGALNTAAKLVTETTTADIIRHSTEHADGRKELRSWLERHAR